MIIKYTKEITIVDGGSTKIDTTTGFEYYRLTGTATLTTNWALTYDGTPVKDTFAIFKYSATVTLAGNHISIMGETIDDDYAAKQYTCTAFYNGHSWDVKVMPDFDETNIIDTTQIEDDAITLDKLAPALSQGGIMASDATKTYVELVAGTDAQILIGNTGNLTSVAVTGVIAITNAGVTSFATDVVSNTVLSNMAANTVKVRNAGTTGDPSDLAVADTAIIIGNGAGFTAASLSNDVTMTNAGVVTIANDAITTVKILNDNVTTAKIADDNVTLAKIADLTGQGYIIRGGVAGDIEEHDASTAGQVLLGDGTDIVSTAVSGLFTLSGAGVATVAPYAISEQLYADLSTATNVGGAGQETLATYTVPAGTVGADGDALEIIAFGTTAATANAKSIRITVGGTDIAINSTTGSPNALVWKYRCVVYRDSNTTARAISTITFNGVADELDYATVAALDWTGATTVVSLNASGAGGGDTTTAYGYEVRLIRT